MNNAEEQSSGQSQLRTLGGNWTLISTAAAIFSEAHNNTTIRSSDVAIKNKHANLHRLAFDRYLRYLFYRVRARPNSHEEKNNNHRPSQPR